MLSEVAVPEALRDLGQVAVRVHLRAAAFVEVVSVVVNAVVGDAVSLHGWHSVNHKVFEVVDASHCVETSLHDVLEIRVSAKLEFVSWIVVL